MFKSVAKEKRLLMWTFYLVSMSGTAQTALSAGIDVMQRTVFSDKSLSAIQTVMFLPSLLGVVSGILSAVLISTGIATKKALTVIGVVLAALVGVLAGFLHTAFWQIIVFGVMIGIGMGFFIPTSQSIMLDNFDERERQLISGFQFAFINLGGIIMSVLSGLVLTLAWYGGYLLLLLFIPIAVMAVVVLPRGERLKRSAAPVDGKTRGKGLPALVFYYTVVLFLFSLLYNAAASNLSTHLSQSNLGTAATAGIAMALLLAGGVVSGAFFGRLSARLDDYMIPLAFLILFVGYTFLNLFAGSLLLTLIATFVAGTSSCLCMPQCVFSVSRLVDPKNSAQASTLIASVAPGFGGFLSPVIITPVTLWLGGESTRFRFQFVGLAALLGAAVFFAVTHRRSRKTRRNDQIKVL